MLYICATPIGNLDDITLRVLNTLKSVDIIAAEDTRRTMQLLNHFEIKNKTTSYHMHNMRQKGPLIIQWLKDGQNVALVSDAGMPGISDPAAELITSCIENNIEFTVLPGATAFATAVVASGLDSSSFIFTGFLPVKNSKKKAVLEGLKSAPHTLIFYESPHRIVKMLELLQSILGDRKCAIARELTKKFEEIFRGNISDAISHFSSKTPKGEFVVLVEKNPTLKSKRQKEYLPNL